jgi:hypothetical protein
MADEQDELAALYGDVQEADQDNATDAANISGAPSSAAAGAGEDDDSLFMQLYGDQPAPEEAAAAKPFDPYAAAREETQKGRLIYRILFKNEQSIINNMLLILLNQTFRINSLSSGWPTGSSSGSRSTSSSRTRGCC